MRRPGGSWPKPGSAVNSRSRTTRMRPGLDPRIVELFEKALELEPDQRAAFLAQACADPAVRAEVESLLAHHESGEADSFLEESAPVTILGAGVGAPTCFGRYRITQTLGT